MFGIVDVLLSSSPALPASSSAVGAGGKESPQAGSEPILPWLTAFFPPFSPWFVGLEQEELGLGAVLCSSSFTFYPLTFPARNSS